MRKFLTLLLFLTLSVWAASAQMVQDASYRVVGHIQSNGVIKDASYRILGHVKKDGTVQDASYKVIGHVKGIPMEWAALYFFFR